MGTILEEKVAEYIELKKKIEELEARKKALSIEIMECMPKESRRVDLAMSWVRRASIFSIKTSFEHAQQLGAVKIEEVIDKAKLKHLYQSGQNPPGVSEIHYIQVYTKNKLSQKSENLASSPAQSHDIDRTLKWLEDV